MRPMSSHQSGAAALLALVEIKEAANAFDRGETNVFDAMDSIVVVVEAYRETVRSKPRRDAA